MTVNKLLGFIFTGIGVSGFVFFLTYNGKVIPLKELWFVGSIFIGVFGSYFLFKHKYESVYSGKKNSSKVFAVSKLRQTGEKVKVTLYNAEVKTRSYNQEIPDKNLGSGSGVLDYVFDDNKSIPAREIRQTYIVYIADYGGKSYKFISRPINTSAESLRKYIDNKEGVDLYVDRINPTDYFFDLPF